MIPARAYGIQQLAQLEPYGVVAGFSGWNAPAITPSRKISAALAAGCTIVLKPSEETIGVALLIAQAIERAGLPRGTVNMVFGDPASIADQLCASPQVSMITFTGGRSEEHTSELQSLMRISYAVFCLKTKTNKI